MFSPTKLPPSVLIVGVTLDLLSRPTSFPRLMRSIADHGLESRHAVSQSSATLFPPANDLFSYDSSDMPPFHSIAGHGTEPEGRSAVTVDLSARP